MIYRVVLDDTYDLHTSDINCMLLNPSLELEMNSAGSFNFTLPPTHPYWDSIEILKSTIDVYEDDDLIFTGRVANIDKNWNNERVIECEGALAYFNDSIHRQMKWETPLPIASEDPTVHNFLKDILDNHNVFVGDAVNRQIHIGHIYIDPYLVTREVDYDTTLDILTRMCIDTNGGYFMIRKDPETHLLYLDWLKDFTEESGQPASFGVNLLDFNTGLHAADICTGVLARGATVNDQVVTLSNVELVDETTYPDMSVDHYTDRYQDILWHREGVEKFGQVVQVHDFPDAQTDWKNGGQVVANSLFEEARKWLEEKNTKIESIDIEVAELSWLQEGVPKYKLGQIVEILDDAHMSGEAYEVRRLPMYKLSCDLSSGSKKVTLGRPPKKELTQISASNSDSSTLSSGNSSGSSSGGGSGSGEDCKVHDVRVDGSSVVSNKIANISLTGKADVSTVNALAATVATKADTSTVNTLANVVSGKQDQIEFNTLEAATETLTRLKANNIVYNIPSGGGGSANIDSGTADPSGGNDGDLYLKISTTATDQDVFGTPVSNTGDDYEIYTDVTIYSTYEAYKAFGTGDGWGKNGTGSANLIYHFKNGKKAKIKSLTYCNNFNVSGGYLCSWFTFYGSNDGTNWTQLYNTNSTTVRDSTATAAISTDTYYEYFKFSCNYTSGFTGLKGIVCIGDIIATDPGIEDIFFKDNGVWLKDKFIKDADSFIYLPTLYSEDEQVVGRWTDGKPLYQKTFLGKMHQRPADWVEFGSVGCSVDKWCYQEAGVTYNDVSLLNEPYVTVRCDPGSDKVYYYCQQMGNVDKLVDGFITVQYTKTTDAPGTGPTKGNLIYLPALYSEEEREVGVWTDGKPLYQRTYKNLGLNVSANTWTNTGISFSDVDYYKVVTNKSYLSDSQSQYPMLYRCYQNTFQVFCQWQMPLDELTIQYTKTTDQPGSATWTPEGQFAHHYSTDEQIVGTWIDGSTLYEKTQNGGITISANDTWYDTVFTGVGKVISFNCSLLRDGEEIGSSFNNGHIDYVVRNNIVKIKGYNFSIGDNFTLDKLTLQYTKSS